MLRKLSVFVIFMGFIGTKLFGSSSSFITPITLSVDTTSINLSYFFNSPIDSITCEVPHSLTSQSSTLHIISNDNTPMLSVLTIWTEGIQYDILLKKSRKQKIEFSFDPKDKSYTNVQLAGQFNDWNPALTPLEFINGQWQTSLFLNPGKYQYQIVLDGEWQLDYDNPNSEPNGSGGVNSVINITNHIEKKPKLEFNITNDEPKINSRNAENVFVFWQNQLMSSEEMNLPKKAFTETYSYLRAYSFNEHGESNSLLIPLKFGNVITNSQLLSPNDKYTQMIYFMLVDRFNNGNKNNDQPITDKEVHEKANYFGGDLNGITQKIEEGYFNDLGVNTVWLSPITQNPYYAEVEYPAPHRKYSGYHGYWPISCTFIDSRFGTSQELKTLVEKAHSNNIHVLLDFVSNHVHEKNPLILNNPTWATDFILENGQENIRIWDEQRLTTWFDRFLPTIDLTIPEAAEAMTDSALHMLIEYNLDGFRHDATKHIPTSYWQTLTQKIKTRFPNKSIYQIGETFGSRELIGSYISSDKLDGQFDFNLYFDSRLVFADDSTGFPLLYNSLMESFEYYSNHSLMGNISGNHDIPRFISYASKALSFFEDEKEAGWTRRVEIIDTIGYNKLKLLSAFNLTIPGVPVIYYGDEIGMVGAGDPDNRRPMIFEGLNKHQEDVKKTVKQLFSLRANNIALTFGEFNLLHLSDNVFVYERVYLNNKAIVMFNKSDKAITLPNIQDINSFKNHFNSITKNQEIVLPPYSFDIYTKQ
ncbi:MAG: alpha-amylase family glycosyl hydrolase [Bacteroidota bacterium]|nr:alpha-amylase family glycosyl hydrolase [Bacteroidota bacterium]